MTMKYLQKKYALSEQGAKELFRVSFTPHWPTSV